MGKLLSKVTLSCIPKVTACPKLPNKYLCAILFHFLQEVIIRSNRHISAKTRLSFLLFCKKKKKSILIVVAFVLKLFSQDIIVNLKYKCLSKTSRSKFVIQTHPNWELLWPFSSPVRSDKCYICTKKTLKKRNGAKYAARLYMSLWYHLTSSIAAFHHLLPLLPLLLCLALTSRSFEQWLVDKWYFSGLCCG